LPFSFCRLRPESHHFRGHRFSHWPSLPLRCPRGRVMPSDSIPRPPALLFALWPRLLRLPLCRSALWRFALCPLLSLSAEAPLYARSRFRQTQTHTFLSALRWHGSGVHAARYAKATQAKEPQPPSPGGYGGQGRGRRERRRQESLRQPIPAGILGFRKNWKPGIGGGPAVDLAERSSRQAAKNAEAFWRCVLARGSSWQGIRRFPQMCAD